MGSATAKRSVIDAEARQAKPKKPLGGINRIGVSDEVGAQRIGHIQAPPPCPTGCTVLSAKLRLRQAGASAGNRTLSLRRITKPWRQGKLAWENRPTRTATVTASATVNGAGTPGRVVEWDVTDDVQNFVDGTWPNYGWTIESSTANEITFYASDAAQRQPELVVTWADKPETPTDLTPAGGGTVAVAKPPLRWAFIDLGGDTTMAGLRVQVHSTASGWSATSGWSSPTWDSMPQASTRPQLDLSGTTYPGATAGATVWWSARHQDGAGLWSGWSDPQSFTYVAQQAGVALQAPGPTVTDTTFPWAWTAPTQARYQLLLRDAAGTEIWKSQVYPDSSARTFTQPRGVVKRTGTTYTAVLRVWDLLTRQAVPGAPAYVEVTQPFVYNDTSSVAGVTNLTATPSGPGVLLSWKRTEMPDEFAIWVDGDEHHVDAGAAFNTGAGTYEHPLFDIAAHVEHTVVVKAIRTDSGVTKASSNNPALTVRTAPVGVWLVDPEDPDLQVVMLEEPGATIVTSDMPEVTEVFTPIGADVSVVTTSALRWFEGSVSGGILAEYGGLSAEEWRDRLLEMKGRRTSPVVQIWGTHAVPVYITNVNVQHVDIPGAPRYSVSYTFVAAVRSPEYELS